EPFGEFVEAIQPKEKIAPTKAFRVRRGRQIALMHALGIKLVQIDIVAKRSSGFVMINDSKRHEHRAAPGTHFIKVHIEPFTDEDDLAWDRRNVIPGE